MIQKIKILFPLLLSAVLFCSNGFSQGIGIGEWRTHLPYDKVIDVALAGDIVFAATEYSMFTYNINDNSVSRFDKVKGLSDVGISKIGYSQDQNLVVVAYSNTNIDIIQSDGSIINIPDIKDKDILGNKTINNILFKNEYAYLSCGFGIVVLDIKRYEIHDTYYIGPDGNAIDVLCMTYNDTSFFASTESGIYYADVNANNLADFNQWIKDYKIPNPNSAFNIIEKIGNNLIANFYNLNEYGGDTLYLYNGTNWTYFDQSNNSRHFQVFSYDEEVYVVNRFNISLYDIGGDEIQKFWSINGEEYHPLAMDKADNEFLWIGDDSKGLIKNWAVFNGEFIKPNGPKTKNVFSIDAEGKNVWVAPGGRQATGAKLYQKDGIFSFIDGTWINHNGSNTDILDTISDMVEVKVDPINTNIAYIATFQQGVLKFENNEFSAVFDDQNSTLQPWVANPTLINVSGLDFDNQNNLWCANTGAPNILSVKKANNDWKSYYLGGSLSGIDVGFLMVDNYNQKWIIKRTDGYIIVYNDGNTIDDQSDDQVRVLSSATGNGAIPGSKVYSFAADLDGEVWVGSDKGVCVFYSPDRIFEPGANFDAQQILVPRNDGSGLADILLETEVVTAITVDGANRKWIGTERAGVFYLSEDGIEQLAHFTTSNSPLLSDNISSITIDSDGEVFIGTANGLISYKSTTIPPPPPGSPVYAYPNPVRENYNGVIAIKGVPVNSNVKITDTYGNLAYETTSEGAQAIWDGYNFDGRRAATGVYLVFVSNDDGSEKLVTKILVIR